MNTSTKIIKTRGDKKRFGDKKHFIQIVQNFLFIKKQNKK